jgi:LuxR family quorum sensing-dependent transcriptional regulator
MAEPATYGADEGRVFDLLAAADRVASREELERVLGAALRAFGFEIVVGMAILRRDGRREAQPIFGDTDHPMIVHYVASGHAAYSPTIEAASTELVFWHDLPRPLSPRMQRIVTELRELFAIHDSCTLTVHPVDHPPVAVCMAGGRVFAFSPVERAILQFLAIHYGLIGAKLSVSETTGPVLSPRQIECLKWVRDGKSATDIGHILVLSARTVEEHLHEACRRLGVKTRTQAVIEAARLGLLPL